MVRRVVVQQQQFLRESNGSFEVNHYAVNLLLLEASQWPKRLLIIAGSSTATPSHAIANNSPMHTANRCVGRKSLAQYTSSEQPQITVV